MRADWSWHGGNLAAATRHFGSGTQPWLDLSTGINPYPWPGATSLAIDWQRLPEPDALAELERVAAVHFGVSPNHICAVPGSELGLRITGGLVGGPACYVVPGYRTHGAMIANAAPIAMEAGGDHAGTLILANPSNPEGHMLPRAQLCEMLAGRKDGAWLLVDEAFADADPAASVADLVGDTQRLLVFRSFGKFFGLAGVRLGFVLGPTSILEVIRASLGAWPVSAAAIAIGTAAYRDDAWIAETRVRLRNRAAALDAMIRRAGHRLTGQCPLFRLVVVPDATAMFARLAERQILTRPFDDHPKWLRIGLPADEQAMARLEAALADE